MASGPRLQFAQHCSATMRDIGQLLGPSALGLVDDAKVCVFFNVVFIVFTGDALSGLILGIPLVLPRGRLVELRAGRFGLVLGNP